MGQWDQGLGHCDLGQWDLGLAVDPGPGSV